MEPKVLPLWISDWHEMFVPVAGGEYFEFIVSCQLIYWTLNIYYYYLLFCFYYSYYYKFIWQFIVIDSTAQLCIKYFNSTKTNQHINVVLACWLLLEQKIWILLRPMLNIYFCFFFYIPESDIIVSIYYSQYSGQQMKEEII